MSIYVTTQPEAYADLGDVWLRDQSARIRQGHLLFERHFRLDADAFLHQAARRARAARAVETLTAGHNTSTDWIREATIAAVERRGGRRVLLSIRAVESIAR